MASATDSNTVTGTDTVKLICRSLPGDFRNENA